MGDLFELHHDLGSSFAGKSTTSAFRVECVLAYGEVDSAVFGQSDNGSDLYSVEY